MSFASIQRDVEAAVAALARVGADTVGWSDEQRQAFDQGRMKPLTEAAAKLITALRKAQEAQQKAERLLSG